MQKKRSAIWKTGKWKLIYWKNNKKNKPKNEDNLRVL